MNELIQTLSALIDQLKAAVADPDRAEGEALAYLEPLLQGITRRDLNLIRSQSLKIREFWLNQVPWCSELSRQLEKVLIQVEEADL